MKPMAWLPLLALALAGCIRGRVAVPADPPTDPPESNRILAQFSCDSGFAGWRVENGATPADRPQPLLMIAETGNAVFAGDGPASILCDVPAPSRYPGRTLARVQIGAPAAPFRLEIDRIWLEK